MPDRKIFDYESSADKRMRRLVFMSSRGCPFNCAHCCNHALKKSGPDSSPYVRFKSAGRMMSEMQLCLGQYDGIEHIIFHDDILNLKRGWFAYENFKVFVSYYVTAQKLGGPLGRVLIKVIDFMWLHRRIYLLLEPVYRSLKKLYKQLFGKQKPESRSRKTENNR